MRRLAVIFFFTLTLCAVESFAQTTKPGVFDDQVIRRSSVDPAPSRDSTSGQPASKKDFLDARQVGFALLVVVGLAFGAKWAAQRFMGIKPGPRVNEVVKLLGRTPISPRQQVLLLKVGRRVIVAADCGGQVSSLSEITDADEVAEIIGKITSRATESAGVFHSAVDKAREEFASNDDAAEVRDEEFKDDADEPIPSPAIAETRAEISGLMEKIRGLSKQFKK